MATTDDGSSKQSRPPKFRKVEASLSHDTKHEPLPEHFSPHRRGQKYVPGGLASQLCEWLINIESTSLPQDKLAKRRDQWLVKILVEQVQVNPSMTMVRGRQMIDDAEVFDGGIVDHLGVVHIIVAGEGTGSGLSKSVRAAAGSVLAIKGPMWQLNIDGIPWGIGTDWQVLGTSSGHDSILASS